VIINGKTLLTNGIINGIIQRKMAGSVEKIIQQMQGNPKNIKFADLCKVCTHYFGKGRGKASSHQIYKTPWQGDPRINIQNDRGMGKAYQVKQVLRAIDKLEAQHGNKNNVST
jgi:hypothetical protein